LLFLFVHIHIAVLLVTFVTFSDQNLSFSEHGNQHIFGGTCCLMHGYSKRHKDLEELEVDPTTKSIIL
ncbi:hypothetical protein ACJX0J_025032, partial [Zea mays]